MAFIGAVNTVKAVLEQLFGTQTLANILYFTRTGGWDEATMEDLADALITWWDATLKTMANSALSLTGVTVTDVETSTGPTITVPVSPASAGGGAGPATPTNAAAVVTFRTAGRGRSARGRNYVGGIDMDNISSVTDITSGLAAGLIAAYEDLADVESALTATHVVVSYYFEKAPRATGLIQPVTSYTCDTAIDSQRRRLRLRGI